MIKIEIYSRGILHCSVCVPADATEEQIEEAVNAENPTGLDHGWHISEAKTFATGVPNPNPCEARDGYLHYLMVC